MKQISFDVSGWEDYIHWQFSDKIILKRINSLIKEIGRTPFSGTGKPEPFQDFGHAELMTNTD